jgi:hypothetical protein
MVNAIQAASFLVYKVAHRPSHKFEEKIEGLLIEHRVPYELDKSFQGFSIQHHIPFYVNSVRNILIETISATSISAARNKAQRIGFKWADLQNAHLQANYTVVLDDRQERSESNWQDQDVTNVLAKYSSHVVLWKRERAELLSVLQIDS